METEHPRAAEGSGRAGGEGRVTLARGRAARQRGRGRPGCVPPTRGRLRAAPRNEPPYPSGRSPERPPGRTRLRAQLLVQPPQGPSSPHFLSAPAAACSNYALARALRPARPGRPECTSAGGGGPGGADRRLIAAEPQYLIAALIRRFKKNPFLSLNKRILCSCTFN